jgi:excisionase family DNA binding protein
VVTTLHQLIDTLTEFPGPSLPVKSSPSSDLPMLLDVTEAARVLSLSRAKVCELASRGDIPSIRVGRAIRIPRGLLVEWLATKTSAAPEEGMALPGWASRDGIKLQ